MSVPVPTAPDQTAVTAPLPFPQVTLPPATAFRPARGLGNAHLQTIWQTFFRRTARIPVTHESWETPAGEPLTLTFSDERQGRPGVLVLHGLEGSSESPYVRGLLGRLQRQGWNGAALDFRSCGQAARHQPGRLLYHAGKTDDVAFVIDRLRARWPHAPLGAVGYSLGGNVLLKWLGETGATASIAASVAVSVPFDLAGCAAAIDRKGFTSTVYREHFLRTLRRKARRIATADPSRLDRGAVDRCRSFTDFDGQVTAPLFGFADAADYWSQNSSARYLAAIRCTTLLINAADDPFVPIEAIPRPIIDSNPALSLWLSSRGGHVGFVSGQPWRPTYLADDLAIDFLSHHLNNSTLSATEKR